MDTTVKDSVTPEMHSHGVPRVQNIQQGRSPRHLIDVVSARLQDEVGLRRLNDPVATTTAQRRLVFNLYASHAESERDVMLERTQVGVTAARARGRKGGRPKGTRRRLNLPHTLHREGQLSAEQIAQRLHISKSTF